MVLQMSESPADEVSSADFFRQDDFGIMLLAEYKRKAELDFLDFKHVLTKGVFRAEKGPVRKTTPFALSLLNSVARQYGVSVATPAELQWIIDQNLIDFGEAFEKDSYGREDSTTVRFIDAAIIFKADPRTGMGSIWHKLRQSVEE